jgi:hypothetical protein
MTKKSSSSGPGGGLPGWVHALWVGASLITPIRKCRKCGQSTQIWRRNCPNCGHKFW